MASKAKIGCEDVVRDLLTFLDGQIEDGRGKLIEQHLEECRSCCSRADFELALRNRVRETAASQPPAELRQKIRRLIDQF